MSDETRIRELLREVTPDPAVTIDVEDVRRGARRRAGRRAAAGSVVLVAAVAVAGFAVQRGGGHEPPVPIDKTPTPTAGTGDWERGPDLPLSPRSRSFTAWTGTEALVIGGSSQTSVGGPYRVADLRDGAAFDPATSSWREIAPSPFALDAGQPSTMVGDTVVIADYRGWLAYDVGDDTWRRLPDPPTDIPQPTLAAEGDVVYAVDVYVDESDAPVQALDLDTDTWSELPLSPHEPQLDQRTLVATPQGLVVMGDDLSPRQAGNNPENAHAERWDGAAWRRFPDSEVQGSGWHWTGERIISTYRVAQHDSDRGGLHTFRAGALDPATGEWSRLPWLPAGDRGLLLDAGWPAAQGPLVFANGYLYDDGTVSSTPVHPPDRTLSSSAFALGDHQLMMFGGYHVDADQAGERVFPVEPTSEVWLKALG